MTRRPVLARTSRRVAGAALLLVACSGAWAHGGAAAVSPWLAGLKSLVGDPSCVLVLLVLALLMAQPGQPRRRPAWAGLALGLAAGTAAATGGVVIDSTLALLGLALGIGALVAWARPWPAALHAVLAATVAAGVVLVQIPAETPGPAFRMAWLAGVLLGVALLFVNAINLVLALLGRKPGPVRRMLLRVAGSWIAAAALLVLVLELGRRNA